MAEVEKQKILKFNTQRSARVRKNTPKYMVLEEVNHKTKN